jgi:tyrosine-protein phosphatase SIW14
MASRWQMVLGFTAAGVVAAAPLVYSSHRNAHVRNLRVVEDGVLYRSGQLSPAGLEQVVRERGIKTVITLRTTRTPGTANPDAWEEGFCAARGLNHVRIVPRVWDADEKGDIPAETAVRDFVRVMGDRRNHPVLVHCFAGIHRTGTMCAIYRIEFQGWPAERAITEMQLCGFDPLDMRQHIEGYLRAYQPRRKPADE